MVTKGHPDWDEVAEEFKRWGESLQKTGRLPPGIRYSRYRIETLPFTPRRIKKLRSAVTPQRQLFALLLGVTAQTVAAWESGTRKPSAMANRFLAEVESDPDHWRARLAALYRVEVTR